MVFEDNLIYDQMYQILYYMRNYKHLLLVLFVDMKKHFWDIDYVLEKVFVKRGEIKLMKNEFQNE